MIKKFNRIAMAMLVAAMPVAFASCSDDENNDEPQPEAVRVVATYNAQIHLSMLDYLDVMVDYPGPDGQVVTDTLGSAEWERQVKYERDNGELPSSLQAVLRIAVKEQSQVQDGSAQVSIGGKIGIESYTEYSNGSKEASVLTSDEAAEFEVDAEHLDDFAAVDDGVIAVANCVVGDIVK